MRTARWICTAASLTLCCVVFAPPASAQCMIVNTVADLPVTGIPSFNRVMITFNNSYVCANVVQSGGANCTPMPGGLVMTVTAVAMTTAPSPYCRWNCGGTACSAVIIDNTLLPVELMEFDVTPGEDSTSERANRAPQSRTPAGVGRGH